ncbi:unnamed protein product [Symbiodinium pilosum]|uniref:Uncharacterized protein n=1 Tax=Symbiodinium pilosum TaxID=2952 RepID=A0A812IVX1_SYMPI|nr:unnamed protein product [Symbiodinium pilosum]
MWSKGSCTEFGFCSEEQERSAYAALLSRLREEDVFGAAMPDTTGRLRINVPFAGRFAEREQLVHFLREEVLNKRTDIREISLFVTDVLDFYKSTGHYGALQSGDPKILIQYTVQDGRAPLPSADVVLAMHPDCSSSYLTSFWGAYQGHYYMWQHILQNAVNSAPLVIAANLWLEESLEVQQVARAQGMLVSAALKNRLYHGFTVTAPLTSNVRDRQPFHYLVIAQREPAKNIISIKPCAEDYAGGYQNQWTMTSHQHWPTPWQWPPPAWGPAHSHTMPYGAPPPHGHAFHQHQYHHKHPPHPALYYRPPEPQLHHQMWY